METSTLMRNRFTRVVPWALLCLACTQPLGAATITVGVLGLEDDARYQSRRLERSYPGHPGGRPLDAARVAAEEAAPEIEAVGHKLVVKTFMAASAAELPKAIAQMKAAKVQHVLLDLSDADLKATMASAPAALGASVFFNIGSAADDLRGTACASNLLHT